MPGHLKRLAQDGIINILEFYFNKCHFKRYGTMKFEVDPKSKSAKLTLNLKGETQPIEVTISNYSLVESHLGLSIELGEIVASREWINVLLSDPKINKLIRQRAAGPIPSPFAGMVKSLLS